MPARSTYRTAHLLLTARGLGLLLLGIAACGDAKVPAQCARDGASAGGSAQGAWSAMNGAGSPPSGKDTALVWSGRELLAWGGGGPCTPLGVCGTGARYDPAADAWAPMSKVGAPAARDMAKAAWAGDEMLIWGGRGCGAAFAACGDGASYRPSTDAWVPLAAGGPAGRQGHSIVWTGDLMIVWGGKDLAADAAFGDGAMLNPRTGSWTPVSMENAPSKRWGHVAAWTGKRMLIWGGRGGADTLGAGQHLGDGAQFDPAGNAWTPMSAIDAPAARVSHTVVWTESEMLVWGGSGAACAPVPCGSEGSGGRQQDPVPPGPSAGPTHNCSDGARYDPCQDAWRPIAQAGAPPGRSLHSAAWTGSKMVVWGGFEEQCTSGCSDGAAYDPVSDRWTSVTSTEGAPSKRINHFAVWTGRQMIVWGGTAGGGLVLTGGALYSP